MINRPKSVPSDRSGDTSDETTILMEVDLVMPGSRSQLRGVTNHVRVHRCDVRSPRLEGSLKTQSITWIL